MADDLKDASPFPVAPFTGEEEIVKKIDQLISQVKKSGEPFPHTLLTGEDDVAKRTIAKRISEKIGTKLTSISGMAVGQAGDLIAMLTNLGDGDILFIEGVDRLRKALLEFLYPALERFEIGFVIDRGPYAKKALFNLKRFTLIGTVPDERSLDRELRNAFFCVYKVGSYSRPELLRIFLKESKSANIKCDEGTLESIAERYGDEPDRALRLFRKTLRYLKLKRSDQLTHSVVEECMGVTEHNIQTTVDGHRERHIPEDVRHEVWRRDGGKCTKCASRERLEYDHIIPISRGGSNTARNVELLCEECNRKKGDTL